MSKRKMAGVKKKNKHLRDIAKRTKNEYWRLMAQIDARGAKIRQLEAELQMAKMDIARLQPQLRPEARCGGKCAEQITQLFKDSAVRFFDLYGISFAPYFSKDEATGALRMTYFSLSLKPCAIIAAWCKFMGIKDEAELVKTFDMVCDRRFKEGKKADRPVVFKDDFKKINLLLSAAKRVSGK